MDNLVVIHSTMTDRRFYVVSKLDFEEIAKSFKAIKAQAEPSYDEWLEEVENNFSCQLYDDEYYDVELEGYMLFVDGQGFQVDEIIEISERF